MMMMTMNHVKVDEDTKIVIESETMRFHECRRLRKSNRSEYTLIIMLKVPKMILEG